MTKLLRGALVLSLLATVAGVVPSVQGANDADEYRLYLESSAKMNEGDLDGAIALLEKLRDSSTPTHILLRLSELYIKTGQPVKSEDALLQAVEQDPDNAGLLFDVGRIMQFELREPEKAEKWFSRAVELAPENIDFKVYLAQSLAAMNRPGEAVTVYDDIIEMEPAGSHYFERGWLQERMGLMDNAVKDYKKAIEIDGNVSAMVNLADIYIERKDYDTAAKHLNNVLEQDPSLALPALKLAELYRMQDRPDDAIKLYRRLLDSSRLNDRAYVINRLATMHYERKEYEQALEYFKMMNEENPDDVQSRYYTGFLLEALDRFEEAEKYYTEALDVRPDFAEVRKRLAIVSIRLEKSEQALEAINGINPADRDIDYYRISAIVLKRLGEEEKAIKVLEEGVAENPASEDLLFELAISEEAKGNHDTAIDLLKRAVSYNPENPVLLNFLGYMYADLDRNIDEATKLVSRALELDPDNPAYLDSMAWVLYRKGEYERALEFQKRALVGAPDEAEIVEHMKAILDKLDNPTTVEAILDDAK